MPSPFPGMDPYLEHPDVWRGVHHLLITESVRQLQPQLQPRGYFADIEERIWLVEPGHDIYPDIDVRLAGPRSRKPSKQVSESNVAVVDVPVRLARNLIEMREGFIEIHQTKPERLITVIEVISLTNKFASDGRRLYRRKQRRLHRTGTHLVEIDLLRRGRRLARVPKDRLRKLDRFDYLIHIDRRDSPDFEMYPVRIPNRLPRIGIPLKSGDDDAVLDLQAAFDQAYDTGPYRVRIDYAKSPDPPLADDDATWAEQLLKDKGLR